MITQNKKCECFISKLRRVSSLIIILILCGISGQAIAGINGVHIFDYDCSSGGSNYNGNPSASTHHLYAGQCTVSDAVYVPHPGKYKVKSKISDERGLLKFSTMTTAVQLDETTSLAKQNVTVSGTDLSYSQPAKSTYYHCRSLVDESNNEYALPGQTTCNDGIANLSPSPPIIPTSCKIHDGAALSVDLKTVDRATAPTVPGTGQINTYSVDVDCSGGMDVSVSMKLNYTPITVSGKEVIQSSSTGLGVAVIYDGNVLSTTDATPITFITGSNTLTLGFQAVRNPTVEVADIPTGAFTASAVLVMTQQ